MSKPETTIQMPRPLCRLCWGENPKLRDTRLGADMLCDNCWPSIEERDRGIARIEAGDFDEIDDEPPTGRTPQRAFSDIKKDYGL